MAAPDAKLLYFIADLMRNSNLQSDFVKDHNSAMTQYGLDPEQQAAMNSGEQKQVLGIIANELANTELFSAVWSKGGVTITSVTPDTGSSEEPVLLTIIGDYFAPGAFVTLQQGTVNFLAQTTGLKNPNQRNAVLSATLRIPPNAEAGKYSVTVSNQDGWYCIQPNAFTIVKA